MYVLGISGKHLQEPTGTTRTKGTTGTSGTKKTHRTRGDKGHHGGTLARNYRKATSIYKRPHLRLLPHLATARILPKDSLAMYVLGIRVNIYKN